MSIFCGCCCAKSKTYVIYLIGNRNHQNAFLKSVLDIEPTTETFIEYKKTYKGINLIIQSCSATEKEINDLHSSMASAVVYLSEKDEPINFQRKSLFVCIGKKSWMESSDNLVVTHMSEGNYEMAKKGFEQLVSMIKTE